METTSDSSPSLSSAPEIVLAPGLTNQAAGRLIKLVSPHSEDEAFPDDPARRARAKDLLTTLLDQGQRYLFYAQNGGPGRASEQRIELKLATDVEHAPNAALSRRLSARSLVLIGVENAEW